MKTEIFERLRGEAFQSTDWESLDYDTILERVVELTVKECLNVMSKTSEEATARFTYMGDDVPTVVHQMNIEKHFGVEE